MDSGTVATIIGLTVASGIGLGARHIANKTIAEARKYREENPPEDTDKEKDANNNKK